MGISLYQIGHDFDIFVEKTTMEMQAKSIEPTTQTDKSFKKIGIILKIATLAVAFFAIAMMSL